MKSQTNQNLITMNVTLFFVRANNPLNINRDAIEYSLIEYELMDRFAKLWVSDVEANSDYTEKYVHVYDMANKDDVVRFQEDENNEEMIGRWCYASTNSDILTMFTNAIKRHEKKTYRVRMPYHTFIDMNVLAASEDEARKIAKDKEWDYLPEEVDQLTSHLRPYGDLDVEKVTK